jgi:hypothetical protein
MLLVPSQPCHAGTCPPKLDEPASSAGGQLLLKIAGILDTYGVAQLTSNSRPGAMQQLQQSGI